MWKENYWGKGGGNGLISDFSSFRLSPHFSAEQGPPFADCREGSCLDLPCRGCIGEYAWGRKFCPTSHSIPFLTISTMIPLPQSSDSPASASDSDRMG